jgi:hypothetical protein
MANESTFIRVNSATELAFGRNPDPNYFFGMDLVQYPGSTAGSSPDNLGLALENTVTAQMTVAINSFVGAIAGLVLIPSFDAATTYGVDVNGTTYSDTGLTATGVLTSLRDDINGDHATDTDPSAVLLTARYNGVDVPALLIFAFGDPPATPPALTIDVATTGGSGTIVGFADPADITLDVWLKPKTILGAAFTTPWCCPPGGKDITVEHNLTDRLDVSGYDRMTLQITNYTARAGMGAGILPLVHVWLAPARSEET